MARIWRVLVVACWVVKVGIDRFLASRGGARGVRRNAWLKLSLEAQLRNIIESRVCSAKSNADEHLIAEAWPEASSISSLSVDCSSPHNTPKEADKIAALPGQPQGVNFDQYSGYVVTVNKKTRRALFYYFVESPYDAWEKPLVLWLNGGHKRRVLITTHSSITKMRNISYFFLFLILASISHANASQQAQLRKFIESRITSGKPNAKEQPVAESSWADAISSVSSFAADCRSPHNTPKEADKIAALPGQPQGVNFDQYSGYVTVNEKNGRALFYYLVESPYNASEKPLILWLTGGPGCSSLGYGAMDEIGPFRVNRDGKTLRRNMHAWNNVANVVFLESPAGVGFSYSNTSSDYDASGDYRTTEDTYIFLVKWLERFPEYNTRDFFISGESYSGHYIPELAATILYMNKYGNNTVINLRGILVGNPYLDNYKNDRGAYEYLWNHGIISDEVWANITKHCSFSPSDGSLCAAAKGSFDRGTIDVYNIYAPICLQSPNGTNSSSSYLPGYDPCSYNYVQAYLNDLEVQKAFHARINTNWGACRNFHWKDAPVTMVPTIRWLVENGLRVWLFSGDLDDVCPLTATRYSVIDLGLPVTKPWRPWYTPEYEVGGYVQQYERRFTFASVRGAGHLVPITQPKRALVLLYSFLKGMLPPRLDQF